MIRLAEMPRESAEEKDTASCPCEFCDAASDRKLQDRKYSEAEAAKAAATRDRRTKWKRREIAIGGVLTVLCTRPCACSQRRGELNMKSKADEALNDWM